MSTRAQVRIISTDTNGSDLSQQSVYHHCDGYPSNMVTLLQLADRMAHEHKYSASLLGRAEKMTSFVIAADPAGYEVEPADTEHSDLAYFYALTIATDAPWKLTVRRYTPKGDIIYNGQLSLADPRMAA